MFKSHLCMLFMSRFLLDSFLFFCQKTIYGKVVFVFLGLKDTKAEEGLPTSDFRLPTFDFRLSTFDFRLPTSDFRLPTSDFRLPTSDFQLQTSDFRLPTSKFKASIFGVQLISPDMESNLVQSESYKLLFLRIVA